MEITIVKLVRQKLLIKTSLNWLKPVCDQLSDITDSQKNWSHKIIIFFHSLQN